MTKEQSRITCRTSSAYEPLSQADAERKVKINFYVKG